MRVKFWGCRGSVPVPDSRMMTYGGNTTCVEFDLDGHILVVDAGTGIRRLGEDLLDRGVRAFDLFITHTHWDHLHGFPFFAPIHSPLTTISILGSTPSFKKLRHIMFKQMAYEYFPISFPDLKATIEFVEVRSGFDRNGWRITTLALNHPITTTGLRLEKGGQAVVFLTDNELGAARPPTPPAAFVEFCRGARYLIHDAQFTEEEYLTRRGWGHSTLPQTRELARAAGVANLVLFHHDPGRTDDQLAACEAKFQADCRAEGCRFTTFAARELAGFTV